jgi:hypothetical protein
MQEIRIRKMNIVIFGLRTSFFGVFIYDARIFIKHLSENNLIVNLLLIIKTYIIMKSQAAFKLTVIVVFLIASSCQEKKMVKDDASQKNDLSQYLGQWTIDIGTNQVGWLEVRKEDGYFDADLLWGGGSVLPVPYIYMADNILFVGRDPRKVIRKKDEKGDELRSHNFPTWVEIKRDGENITGYYLRPKTTGIGFDSVFIKGTKLPDVPKAPDMKKLKYGEPVNLLDNKDLKGWKLVEQNRANGWSVVDGILINDPVQKEGTTHVTYGNLRTLQEFEDFNLKLDVNVPAQSNSGVYLRGRYEIQVSDSYGLPLDPHNMGALYSRLKPTVSAEKPAGEWQSLNMTLCDRHLTVILNGKTIIDNQPVYGPTGGALTSDVFAPGPIYLQGDHGKISYRNIILTPIIK